mgnify:CR=1 FL=1|tara:strand:+ start:5730 stop:7718 length:1989 start_codon:yes stop_codon:yes gene_type:complete
MKKLEKFSLYEAPGKGEVVFTFGRFNPPTTGHEKLINKVKSVAGSNDYKIFPSYTQNQNKDPLPHALKIAYMRKMFPRHARNIIADKKALTAMNIATALYDQGYTELTMVVGSDRVKEFERLLTTYNNVSGKRHGFYNFKKIKVVSAGDRDPDAEGVSGMSASKMRQAAVDGKVQDFEQGVPSGFKDARKLYRDVRKNMGIREQKDMGNMNDYESLRDAYLTGKIWNIGDIVEANNISGEIIQRGTNYVAFKDKTNKVHKAWLNDINEDKEVKQDKDIKDREGTQPAKYYAKDAEGDKMSKSTKQARARHFAKYGKKNDDMDKNYKPAPGDAGGKTKPSKHTKKYNQMFGKEEYDSPYFNEKIDGLVKKADKSGMPYSVLKKVYDRGMAAWKTGHRPGTTPQQWAFARVNSFITKSSGTWGGADKDLAKKVKGESFTYPNEYAAHTRDVTPGEKKKITKENIDEWFVSENTRFEYALRFEDDWWWKLNETHDAMLEKIGVSCCEPCEEETVDESLWANIHKKRQRIKQGSGEKMRKKGDKGAPSPDAIKRAKGEQLSFKEYQETNAWGEIEEDAEYQGRKVKLNNPMPGDVKKTKVYVKNDKGNVVKVEFGDPNMDIKRDDPERRKSFRARHNCDNPGPKYKARYWSCKFWSTKSVSDLMKG